MTYITPLINATCIIVLATSLGCNPEVGAKDLADVINLREPAEFSSNEIRNITLTWTDQTRGHEQIDMVFLFGRTLLLAGDYIGTAEFLSGIKTQGIAMSFDSELLLIFTLALTDETQIYDGSDEILTILAKSIQNNAEWWNESIDVYASARAKFLRTGPVWDRIQSIAAFTAIYISAQENVSLSQEKKVQIFEDSISYHTGGITWEEYLDALRADETSIMQSRSNVYLYFILASAASYYNHTGDNVLYALNLRKLWELREIEASKPFSTIDLRQIELALLYAKKTKIH